MKTKRKTALKKKVRNKKKMSYSEMLMKGTPEQQAKAYKKLEMRGIY